MPYLQCDHCTLAKDTFGELLFTDRCASLSKFNDDATNSHSSIDGI